MSGFSNIHHVRQDHFSVFVFQFFHVFKILGNFESMEWFLLKIKDIMLTSLCNVEPLIPHFYIVKLGFTEVYIFLMFAPKH